VCLFCQNSVPFCYSNHVDFLERLISTVTCDVLHVYSVCSLLLTYSLLVSYVGTELRYTLNCVRGEDRPVLRPWHWPHYLETRTRSCWICTLTLKYAAAGLKHSKLRARILKKMKIYRGQRSKSTCQKLWIISSVIVTDIPIKPQQFPTGRFWVACCTLQWPWPDPWPWELNRRLDILDVYLHTENEVARWSHSIV